MFGCAFYLQLCRGQHVCGRLRAIIYWGNATFTLTVDKQVVNGQHKLLLPFMNTNAQFVLLFL